MIRLIGPGGAGKTTTGALLAQRLGIGFVDVDQRFAAAFGDVSEYLAAHGYATYATQNVKIYLSVTGSVTEPVVLALSSGFMTYAHDVHLAYATIRREIVADPRTIVLLPSLDCETCAVEIVRRQLGRRFCRSAEREERVIRQRFGIYRSLSATKIETMKPVAEVVEAVMASLLPN
jgi:shikimate kinase